MRRASAFFQFGRQWLTGAVAAYLLCAFLLGGHRSAKPVFAVSVGGWASTLLWLRRCPLVRGPGRGMRAVELAAFNVALTLTLGELGLRGLSALAGRSPLVEDSLAAQLLVPGRNYGRGLRGNALGFPGPDFSVMKPSSIARVAALGDSFAVGPAAPYGENFLVRTERAIEGTEVLNFGVSGTGPREYLAVLSRHVWAYTPDLILVCVFVGNDITETLATPRHLDPRQSQLFLFLGRTYRVAAGGAPLRGAGHAGPALAGESFAAIEGRRLAICLRDPPAGLEKKWRAALGYLEAIGAECRGRHTPVAFVLIPDELQTNPSVRDLALATTGLKAEQLDLEAPQRRLQAFCAARGWPCLDLLPAFRGQTDAYAPWDTHWNATGNRLASGALAPWLASHLRRPLRSQDVALSARPVCAQRPRVP